MDKIKSLSIRKAFFITLSKKEFISASVFVTLIKTLVRDHQKIKDYEYSRQHPR